MKLAVTGATGYIGQSLVCKALESGHFVIALARRELVIEGVEWIHFDLADEHSIALPPSVDAVVHLAATTHMANVDSDMEVQAARRLREACRKIGARFIFVSSQTARKDAPTAYGRSKWLIEEETRGDGGFSVRPGQVYGGRDAALFGVLVNAVRVLPVIPAFIPSPKIQPVHVDDLAQAILAIAQSENSKSLFSIGSSVPITFTNFLKLIANKRLRRGRLVFPVPVFFVRIVSNLIGEKLRSRIGLDKLVSLFDLPQMTTVDDLRALDIKLRPISLGMSRSCNPRRRALLEEGYILFLYLLREAPSLSLLRRYVHCIEQLSNGVALGLPTFLLRTPSMMALLDMPGGGDPSREQVGWRLQAAIALSEASQQGAGRYLLLGRFQGMILNSVRITAAIFGELGWRLLSPILGPMLRRAMSAKEHE